MQICAKPRSAPRAPCKILKTSNSRMKNRNNVKMPHDVTMSCPVPEKIIDLLIDMICVVDAGGRYVFVSAACEQLLGYTQEELLGRNMADFVFPEDRERTLAAAANVMRGQSHSHFENRYVRKDGRIVHIMWSARWFEPDRIRLAVARDITALKHAARVQSALYRISEAAHTADGLFELYRDVHRIIADLLAADNFLVALYEASSQTLSFPYFVDARQRQPEPQPLSTDTPIAKVILSGQALLTTPGAAGAIPDKESAVAGDCADWLGVPLISQQCVMGALVVQTYSGSGRYTEEDKDLLQFVSTQVAAAIERKQTETRLRHMANYDALTELPNRTLFYDRLDTALKRARRDREHLALLYLDLDGFKCVNDTFGHEVGDLLLREVGRRLMRCLQESDTVGRMGGDEFTVLLPNIHKPDNADIVVEKIRAAISDPFKLDGQTLTISASIGVAVYPKQGRDGEQLFRHADASMYAAKRRGN